MITCLGFLRTFLYNKMFLVILLYKKIDVNILLI